MREIYKRGRGDDGKGEWKRRMKRRERVGYICR
jgi:hypothetical protein